MKRFTVVCLGATLLVLGACAQKAAQAEKAEAAITANQEAYLASAPQVNPEAYNLYLKGWHFHNLESRESIPKAVEYLEQAVELDPDFAQAWAALGHSYLLMQWYGGWNRDYSLNRMKPALDKALELDPNQAQAHSYLGAYRWFSVPPDIAGAEASNKRAVELDPDNAHIRYQYGYFLYRTGRPDEALAEFRRAQELEPLNPLPLQGIGRVLHATRQYDKALESWQACLKLSPDQVVANILLIPTKHEILMQQGRYAEVAEQVGVNTILGMRAEWARGNKEKVYAVRDELGSTEELRQWEQRAPFHFARLYGIMGEKEKALSLLERAYQDTFTYKQVINLVYDPEFDPLRVDPRFKALLQKLEMTEVFDQNGQRIR